MINWFPGHMAKANRDIKKMQKLADLFIIVLDGRAPLSTYNEELDDLAPNTPRLFLVTKHDLSDLSKKDFITKQLIKKHGNVLWVNLKKQSAKKIILKEASKVFEQKKIINMSRGIHRKVFRVIVLGVPNSGKSTLINSLAGKKVAKIANKPGVTRIYRWINIKNLQIMDTPGVLWPKFHTELIGIKLAMIGAINLDAIQIEDLAYESLKLLSLYYPNKLKKLKMQDIKTDKDAYNAIYNLAIRNKWVLKDDKPNMNKAMKYVINFTKDLKGVTFD